MRPTSRADAITDPKGIGLVSVAGFNGLCKVLPGVTAKLLNTRPTSCTDGITSPESTGSVVVVRHSRSSIIPKAGR